MSRLAPRDLSYRTVVAEFFLGLRGGGLMLSPLDGALVKEWEQRGIPAAVVCRGLRAGFERWVESHPRGAAPRSLKTLRLAVEEEWKAFKHGRVGDAAAPPGEAEAVRARLAQAKALLAEAGRKAKRLKEAYRAAWRALAHVEETPELAALEAAMAGADRVVLRAWLRSLDAPSRRDLGRRCVRGAGPRTSRMRAPAYREALRAHLCDAAREAGLLRLAGSV